MTKIFVLRIEEELDQRLFKNLTEKISSEKKERILRFHNVEDAHRGLFAELLLRYLLIKEYNYPPDGIRFYVTEYGKPYLTGGRGIHFNLSHSGEWIVCALSETLVGIDIERLSAIDLDIVPSYFSKKEAAQLFSLEDEKRLSYFFEIWTLKESYIKMKGMGLSIALDEFSVIPAKTIIFESKHEKENVYFRQYEIAAHYKMAVCGVQPVFSKPVTVKQQHVIDFFLTA